MIIKNVKIHADHLQVHVTFGNQSLHEVVVQASMSEIVASFDLPILSEAVIGPVPLTVWTGNGSRAHLYFECADSRKAELLYRRPSTGDAGETLVVTIGIDRWGELPANVYSFR